MHKNKNEQTMPLTKTSPPAETSSIINDLERMEKSAVVIKVQVEDLITQIECIRSKFSSMEPSYDTPPSREKQIQSMAEMLTKKWQTRDAKKAIEKNWNRISKFYRTPAEALEALRKSSNGKLEP